MKPDAAIGRTAKEWELWLVRIMNKWVAGRRHAQVAESGHITIMRLFRIMISVVFLFAVEVQVRGMSLQSCLGSEF